MRRFLTPFIIAVLFFAATAIPLSAIASSQIIGTATSCSGFYTCSYAINSSQGNGWARTYGYLTFQLPGEVKSSISQSYQIRTLGQTGNTYHIGGSFLAINANTGKVVKGNTSDYITQTQHCYIHGCYYTYSLVNGTITFTLTRVDGTTNSVACNPSTFNSGGSTVCTVKITDIANSTSFPSGKVRLTASNYGAFSSRTCTLSSGSCSVTFTPSDNSVGGISITATYPGDSTHYKSSNSTTVYVNGN